MRHLAQLFPTAIVSGRGREKVQAFVKLKELYYAGSHGMDIAGPQVRHRAYSRFNTGPGECARECLKQVHHRAQGRCKGGLGAGATQGSGQPKTERDSYHGRLTRHSMPCFCRIGVPLLTGWSPTLCWGTP